METKYSVNDLEPQTLREIFRLTGSHQCAQLATCQKLWRTVASDESLWQHWGHEDFAMEESKTPSGQLLCSWRDAYVAWLMSVGKYGKYARRAILAWRKIERWTAKHTPGIAKTLMDPASEIGLDYVEEVLGFPIPDSLRVIYRLHNGQLPEPAHYGLFGGYSFYDHVACTYFPSVREAVDETIHLRAQIPSTDYADGLLLGFNLLDTQPKSLMLVDKGCQLRVGRCHLAGSWDAVPPGGNDAVLRWLEHYADALHQQFACGPIRHDLSPTSIRLYPVKPPWQRECVTRGVRVRAAAIFVPELSRRSTQRSPVDSHFFAYNVEFSLLPPDEQKTNWSHADGLYVRPIASVQLQTRHWIMRDENEEVTSEVRGEGVIGEFPVLVPGGTPFVYQSCTQSLQSRSSMEGSFTFVEGTIQAPSGPLFDVQCPQFSLEKPDYVF